MSALFSSPLPQASQLQALKLYVTWPGRGCREPVDEMPSRNVVTWNFMINGYFKKGKLDKAFALLGLMPKPDIYTYNTVISGLV
ncbi:Pentatricopeptide repeat-containing protein At2g35030, mitochondrial [Linum grandiflorum]